MLLLLRHTRLILIRSRCIRTFKLRIVAYTMYTIMIHFEWYKNR